MVTLNEKLNTRVSLYKSLNSNVKLVFLFSLFQSLGRGIWLGNVLSAYIFFIAGQSNTILGLTSGATGLAMTIVVFPSGYFADKYRRDTLLKIAGILGIFSLVLTYLATTIIVILVALVFWGLFQGITRPSLESIFADSVESGDRSSIYAYRQLIRQVGMAIGPLINVFLFLYLGDVWELNVLKVVILIGLIISGISLGIMFFFNDNKSMGQKSEYIEDYNDIKVDMKVENRNIGARATHLIPIILVSSNLIIGIGAGMTIKFFPIFFLQIYYLQPILVNIILFFLYIGTGIAAIFAQKLSLHNGRALMIFIVQMLATLCLFALSLYPVLIIMIILFILRGSLMNASQPLSRSILMDVVAKHNRGKINSIESLAWGLFWNASAAIGGFLIDAYGYDVTFRITATIYTLGTLPILLLIPLVKREKMK